MLKMNQFFFKGTYPQASQKTYIFLTLGRYSILSAWVSQLVHNLRKPTLQAAYKVIYHLKSSLWKGLTIQKNDTLTLEAYTNADYVGSPIDMRPPMWYCAFFEAT